MVCCNCLDMLKLGMSFALSFVHTLIIANTSSVFCHQRQQQHAPRQWDNWSDEQLTLDSMTNPTGCLHSKSRQTHWLEEAPSICWQCRSPDRTRRTIENVPKHQWHLTTILLTCWTPCSSMVGQITPGFDNPIKMQHLQDHVARGSSWCDKIMCC